jgi:hypothetical protein
LKEKRRHGLNAQVEALLDLLLHPVQSGSHCKRCEKYISVKSSVRGQRKLNSKEVVTKCSRDSENK